MLSARPTTQMDMCISTTTTMTTAPPIQLLRLRLRLHATGDIYKHSNIANMLESHPESSMRGVVKCIMCSILYTHTHTHMIMILYTSALRLALGDISHDDVRRSSCVLACRVMSVVSAMCCAYLYLYLSAQIAYRREQAHAQRTQR